jgi:hypothetical protein
MPFNWVAHRRLHLFLLGHWREWNGYVSEFHTPSSATNKASIEILKCLNPVSMDASSRPECTLGTRRGILTSIAEWLIFPSDGQNILWLYGIAGVGKSTISATIAEYFASSNDLAWRFHFFDRNDPTHVTRMPLSAHSLIDLHYFIPPSNHLFAPLLRTI